MMVASMLHRVGHLKRLPLLPISPSPSSSRLSSLFVATARRTLASAAQAQQPPPPPQQRVGRAALELKELRLICNKGTQLGVMAPTEALDIAKQRALLLKEVSPSAMPPVWKLFEKMVASSSTLPPPQQQQQQQQQATERAAAAAKAKPDKKAAARDTKPPKIKEVRLTDRSDLRDADTKAANAIKFLSKGHIVRIFALNTGRVHEETGVSRAQVLVQRVIDLCAEHADSNGIGGKAKIADDQRNRQVLGRVEAVLTPKGGARRGEPEPRKSKG